MNNRWPVFLLAVLFSVSARGGPNTALRFDGSDDFLLRNNVTGLNSGNTPHTIEAWVNVAAYPLGRAWILQLGNDGTGHHWLLNADGSTQIGAWGGSQLFPVLSTGVWTHVASVFDGSTLRVYINGGLVGSMAGTFDLQGIPLTLAQQHLGEQYFSGLLDEVRIWNVARSATEIDSNMNRRLTGTESGLVLYYPLDEGSGFYANDATVNGNTGFLFNGPTWMSASGVLTLIQEARRPHVAQLNNGSLVFVWEDRSGADSEVFMQMFDSSGIPAGVATQVNVVTADDQSEPSVAALSGGGFIVAFSSRNFDGDGYAAVFRRYDASGNALDPAERQVNSVTTLSQFKPEVAPLANGGFVAAFIGQSGGDQQVYYRRFDADGNALDAADIAANGLGSLSISFGDQGSHQIAALANGGFVIVYEDRWGGQIFGVRFDQNGNATDAPSLSPGTKQFQVNQSFFYDPTQPAAAGLPGGGFVAVYNSESVGAAESRRVSTRVFDANGTGQFEFQVGSHASRWQDAHVAGLPGGGFIVAWQATGEGGVSTNTWSIFAQRFDDNGNAISAPFMVNMNNTDNQVRSKVLALQDNGFAIAWETIGASDGSHDFGWRVFAPNNPPTLSTIADQRMQVDTSISIPFTIGDTETPANSLTVSGNSSNPFLLPSGTLTIGGTGASRSVTITPATGQFGFAYITIAVTDSGGLTTTRSFWLTVYQVEGQLVIKAAGSPGNPQFPITFTGVANQTYRLEGSFDLAAWFEVFTTNTPTGVVEFTVTPTGSFSRQFFRVVRNVPF